MHFHFFNIFIPFFFADSFMNSINTVFASLGVRGLSFLFASGDSGVGGDSSCGPQGQFVPSYPAGSPYVTAVGGTTLSKPFERGNEVAWSGSGGGFSNIFQQPAWQKNAVQTYLSKSGSNLPPSNLYNATGRAYPDVAAFSTGFSVVVDLIPQPVKISMSVCFVFPAY
jgi:tripeptidyl-peptidase-1